MVKKGVLKRKKMIMRVIISCSPSYLVKSRVDVVSKLDLSNGCGTSNGYTNTKSHNPLFTKGSVEDSVLTWRKTAYKTEYKTKPLCT